MSAMMAAIKKRKMGGDIGDHGGSTHQSMHADDKQKDLHGLVASLSEDEKGKLKHILSNDGSRAMAIQKGEPSSEEQGKIEESIAEENQENALDTQHNQERHPEDSDEIAMSMLDHKSIAAAGTGQKPRNLGERARMAGAEKLKAKGKL